MGMEVTNTGVRLTEQGGGTIVDGIGLVSTEQFAQAGGTNSADNQSVVGTATTPLNNGTISVVLEREALMFYTFTVDAYENSSTGFSIFPTINGTIPYGGAGKYFAACAAGNTVMRPYTSFHFEALAAGTNSIILNANAEAGGTINVTRWRAGYVVFGK